MEQETAQELCNRERQGSFLVAMGGIAPAKGDLPFGKRDQAMIGDGYAMGVAAQILEPSLSKLGF